MNNFDYNMIYTIEDNELQKYSMDSNLKPTPLIKLFILITFFYFILFILVCSFDLFLLIKKHKKNIVLFCYSLYINFKLNLI